MLYSIMFSINRSPYFKLNGGLPEEAWSGKKVELGHLKVFGCPAYAHVEATERSKLDPKSRKMIFIGYPRGSQGLPTMGSIVSQDSDQ
uniref:hypothetical protein n=1 Tax=Areca yellow leaf disease phytoplasma TaxID=927614 RepID=UPI00403FCC78